MSEFSKKLEEVKELFQNIDVYEYDEAYELLSDFADEVHRSEGFTDQVLTRTTIEKIDILLQKSTLKEKQELLDIKKQIESNSEYAGELTEYICEQFNEG